MVVTSAYAHYFLECIVSWKVHWTWEVSCWHCMDGVLSDTEAQILLNIAMQLSGWLGNFWEISHIHSLSFSFRIQHAFHLLFVLLYCTFPQFSIHLPLIHLELDTCDQKWASVPISVWRTQLFTESGSGLHYWILSQKCKWRYSKTLLGQKGLHRSPWDLNACHQQIKIATRKKTKRLLSTVWRQISRRSNIHLHL